MHHITGLLNLRQLCQSLRPFGFRRLALMSLQQLLLLVKLALQLVLPLARRGESPCTILLRSFAGGKLRPKEVELDVKDHSGQHAKHGERRRRTRALDGGASRLVCARRTPQLAEAHVDCPWARHMRWRAFGGNENRRAALDGRHHYEVNIRRRSIILRMITFRLRVRDGWLYEDVLAPDAILGEGNQCAERPLRVERRRYLLRPTGGWMAARPTRAVECVEYEQMGFFLFGAEGRLDRSTAD